MLLDHLSILCNTPGFKTAENRHTFINIFRFFFQVNGKTRLLSLPDIAQQNNRSVEYHILQRNISSEQPHTASK